MAASQNHIRAAIKLAARYGFRLHRHRKHMIWRNRRGAQVVCSATPSDHHALANFEARLKRYG